MHAMPFPSFHGSVSIIVISCMIRLHSAACRTILLIPYHTSFRSPDCFYELVTCTCLALSFCAFWILVLLYSSIIVAPPPMMLQDP